MATNDDAARGLREKILEEARRESEEIVARAREEAEAVLSAALVEASRVSAEQLERGRAEATRRSELIKATVPVETGRMRVAHVESLLESVRTEAARRLSAREGFTYREAAVNLAALAVNRMAGDAFVLVVPLTDSSILGDGACNDIMQRIDRAAKVTLKVDPKAAEGSLVVQDPEAWQTWDNGLSKRLERMWPELRRQIALDVAFVPKTESGGISQ